MPWVFPSVSVWVLLCMRLHCLFLSDVSVVSVSLAFLSCPDVLCWILRHLAPSQAPPHTLLYTHRHTQTHTYTHTISQDKLGFCDFVQIRLQIREKNLKALLRQSVKELL